MDYCDGSLKTERDFCENSSGDYKGFLMTIWLIFLLCGLQTSCPTVLALIAWINIYFWSIKLAQKGDYGGCLCVCTCLPLGADFAWFCFSKTCIICLTRSNISTKSRMGTWNPYLFMTLTCVINSGLSLDSPAQCTLTTKCPMYLPSFTMLILDKATHIWHPFPQFCSME